mmetsp:Transcript_17577/g.25822  ORF Transcript_17577/g.25822 Transcript_17577/m.25822 type:complete len:108 (-) Transcript_17577:183-506(-)
MHPNFRNFFVDQFVTVKATNTAHIIHEEIISTNRSIIQNIINYLSFKMRRIQKRFEFIVCSGSCIVTTVAPPYNTGTVSSFISSFFENLLTLYPPRMKMQSVWIILW